MALTTQPAVIGGASKTLIVGADANGNIASAHVVVGADGIEKAVLGNPLIVSDPAAETALATVATSAASSSSTLSSILAALAGILRVNVQNATLAVTGAFFQSTQPISASSLPLPTGAATAAGQPALNPDGGGLAHVTNFPATQAISATTLPLPIGASQDGVDATGVAGPTGGIGIRGWLSGIYSRLGSPLAVTGTFFQATQPVSGTITANAGTGVMAVSAAALPLPTGAATSAGQAAINADGGAQSHVMNFPASQAVTLTALPALAAGANTIGSVTQAGGPWAVSWSGQSVAQSGTWTVGLAAGSSIALAAGSAAIGSVSVTGAVAVTGAFFQATQPISAASLPLPANAAQDGTDGTGITPPSGAVGIRGWLSGSYGTLVSILAALAGTLRVTVQNSSLAVTGTFFQATQPVSLAGTVAVQGVAGGVPQPVITPLAAPITGQVKIATTGTAINLPTGALVNGITVSAKASNAAQAGSYSSTVGGSSALTTVNDGTGNGYPLAPGGSISFSSANANQIWINGTAGDVFAYAAG